MAHAFRERRRHKRHKVPCPAKLLAGDGGVLASAKTANISDGGGYFVLTGGEAGDTDGAMLVKFSVPRSTANTFMYEDFSSSTRVVRRETGGEGHPLGIALQFSQPLDLGLEV